MNCSLQDLRRDRLSYWWGVPRDIITVLSLYLRPGQMVTALPPDQCNFDGSPDPDPLPLQQEIAQLSRTSFPRLLRFLRRDTYLQTFPSSLLQLLSHYLTPQLRRPGLSLFKQYITSVHMLRRCSVDFDRTGHVLIESSPNNLTKFCLATGTSEIISNQIPYYPLNDLQAEPRQLTSRPFVNLSVIHPDLYFATPLPSFFPLEISNCYPCMSNILVWGQYLDHQGHLLVIEKDPVDHSLSFYRTPLSQLSPDGHPRSACLGRPLLRHFNGFFTCEDPVTYDLYLFTNIAVYRVRNQQAERILSTKKMGYLITAAIDLEGRLITVHEKFLRSGYQTIISIYQ